MPAPTGPLPARFRRHLRESRLIPPGSSVLVAVSGGLDSVVLLHLLRGLARPARLRLRAAHFDHRMRPGSADDAAWVAGLCRAWQVPLRLGRARRPPRSEAAARAARYRFLRRALERVGARRLATGHHADDQAETVLFRVVRGTGLRGLAGIPERRGPIVRPLLPFRRSELAAYARAAGLGWREDPTNLSLEFARNRIRHELIPRLEGIAPGATEALLRLARHARTAEEAWDDALDRFLPDVVLARSPDAIELARPRLLSYHPEIRARMLRRLLRRLGSRPGSAGTREALKFIHFGASGGRIHAAGGVLIERDFDRIRLRRFPRPDGPAATERPLLIREPGEGEGEAVIGGRRFLVRWSLRGRGDGEFAAEFDPSALRFPLELRAWRPGDRIRLPYGAKKLKKLFAERRVARHERGRTAVLADHAGRVLWVPGLARATGAEPGRGGASLTVEVRRAAGAGSEEGH